MKTISLATVRQHTGCKLTYGEACTLVNPGDPFLRNIPVALMLHPWLNTNADWLRLEAALVILAAHRRSKVSENRVKKHWQAMRR